MRCSSEGMQACMRWMHTYAIVVCHCTPLRDLRSAGLFGAHRSLPLVQPTFCPCAHLALWLRAHSVSGTTWGIQQVAVHEPQDALARHAASALAGCWVPARRLLRQPVGNICIRQRRSLHGCVTGARWCAQRRNGAAQRHLCVPHCTILQHKEQQAVHRSGAGVAGMMEPVGSICGSTL